jgi:hypothetical protein
MTLASTFIARPPRRSPATGDTSDAPERAPQITLPAAALRDKPRTRALAAVAFDDPHEGDAMASTEAPSGYAPVGDLNMHYEISGDCRPTILLHGAYRTIDTIGPLLPGLAETRKVIAVEQQGDRRTADIDRPLTYEQMADDTAAAGSASGGSMTPTPSATAWAAPSPCRWRSAIRRWCESSSSRPRRSGATACPPRRSPCSRRSRPSSSPGADRGRVPPDRTRPRRLPKAGRQAQATRHDGLSPGRRRTSGRSPRPR